MARAIGINHVALEAGDIDEALAWYARFLDFELRGRRPTMPGSISATSSSR